ncbi:MAG: uroporphyrinogen decarboxylase family protein [Syntrophobacteraceae bacterium]|jgi:uroporphyrinogen-III decarboxylase
MARETMNVFERFEAAVNISEVDRPPVFPILVTAAARLCDLTQAEAWKDHNKAREAIIKCYHDFGYDYASKPNFYYDQVPGKLTGAPVRNLIPGKQLPEDAINQIDERILFDREDYDKIASVGWNAFWEEHYEKMSGRPFSRLVEVQQYGNKIFGDDLKICQEQGIPMAMGAAVDSVMMAFSLCRTLIEFTKDLRQVPDKVEKAMNKACDDLIMNALEMIKRRSGNMAYIILERGSGALYPLPTFERFEWPFLKRYVETFVAEGITPWMHLDTDWSKNLPYFKQLPKGKCVADLDSTTNIFRAKEILGGHMCISGDVPASLFSLGKPEDVADYCKKLIREVGKGGGFMLTSGCECPIDVKRENLMAFVETGRNYQP